MASEKPLVEMSKEEACKNCESLRDTLDSYNALIKHANDYMDKLEAMSKHLLALEETQPDMFEGVPKEILKPERAKVIDPTHLVSHLINRYQEQRELAAKNSNETLQQSLDEVKHQLEKTQGELREMTSKYTACEKQRQASQAELEEITSKYTESEEQAEKLQEEIEKNKNQMDDLKQVKIKLEDKLQKQSDEFEKQRQASQGKLEEMTSKYTASEEKAEKLQEELEQTKNQMNDLQQVKIKLENELQKRGEEFKKLRHDSDKVTTKLRELHEWLPNTVEYCCEVPETAHTDPRLTGILGEFMRRVNVHMSGHATMDTRAVAGPSIDGRVPVLLPCVAASRVGSDITAALAKADIVSGARVILLIFHHLAPHNSRIGVPTEQRLSDRSLLDQCVGMVDAVFWNGAMYDCAANQTAVTRVQELFRWSLSLQDLQRLNQIVQ